MYRYKHTTSKDFRIENRHQADQIDHVMLHGNIVDAIMIISTVVTHAAYFFVVTNGNKLL